MKQERKKERYLVYFTNDTPVEVYALSILGALVLAMAERIGDGKCTLANKIECPEKNFRTFLDKTNPITINFEGTYTGEIGDVKPDTEAPTGKKTTHPNARGLVTDSGKCVVREQPDGFRISFPDGKMEHRPTEALAANRCHAWLKEQCPTGEISFGRITWHYMARTTDSEILQPT